MSGADPNRARIIATWISDLASLTRSGGENAANPQRIKAYTAMLADDFPSNAFTKESLRAVAGEWFPSYADLRDKLGDWWREEEFRRKQTHAPRIEGPGADDLTAMDRHWLNWHAAHGAEYPEDHVRSLLARYAPGAYRSVFGETVEERRLRRTGLTDEQREAAGAAIGRAMRGADQRPKRDDDEFGDRAAWASPPAPEPPPPVTARHIPDAALLAAYEREATDPAQPYGVRVAAATRAATIRRKLGLPVAANDRENPQEDARP